MIELPRKVVKATRVNPKHIILFSSPKVGKTTAVSGLDNALLLDLENGSGFVDAVKINVLEEARKNKILPVMALKTITNKIKEENNKAKAYVYKYGIIDTASALENMVLPLAAQMYKNTVMGKNWNGDGNSILDLPRGAGYKFLREAYLRVSSELEECFDTLITLGHVKDSALSLNGEEVTERSLSLTGQLSSIVCSKADAVGYLYRKDNETIANFKISESLNAEGRCKHLSNKEITLISSDEEGNLTVDWSQIFINEK